MDIHKLSINVQNLFRHLMARHLCCEEFNQINLDGFFVRVFTNLEIPFVFSFILGGSVDNQGSVWGQLGALRTKDHPIHPRLGASLNNIVLAAHE
jgi:hypothetical protein